MFRREYWRSSRLPSVSELAATHHHLTTTSDNRAGISLGRRLRRLLRRLGKLCRVPPGNWLRKRGSATLGHPRRSAPLPGRLQPAEWLSSADIPAAGGFAADAGVLLQRQHDAVRVGPRLRLLPLQVSVGIIIRILRLRLRLRLGALNKLHIEMQFYAANKER